MILITGGSGSGKSAYGEKRILEAGEMTRYYIATMEVFGEEGRKKVERHREMRKEKGFVIHVGCCSAFFVMFLGVGVFDSKK